MEAIPAREQSLQAIPREGLGHQVDLAIVLDHGIVAIGWSKKAEIKENNEIFTLFVSVKEIKKIRYRPKA